MLSALPGGLLGARHGDPPARVVALHGWARTHADFDAVLTGLDATAPDLPGFGATPAPAQAWGAAEYAVAVAALCDEGMPPVVVGHSFGGRMAVVLAAEHPGKVSALVLSGVPLLRPAGHSPPRPSSAHRAARRLHGWGLVSDARMEALRRRHGSLDYRSATGVMRDVLVRAIAETDDGTYRRALAALSCPVELVWGAQDAVAPPAVAMEAAEIVGSARVTLIPAVGHLTPTEAPDEVRAAIDRHR